MLSFLCLFALPHQAPIDMEMRAARLPLVVEALGEKLNQRMFCSPEIGRHVVLVKFAGVSPDEAKLRIAEAVDAEWIDRNGTQTLIRTPAKQRQLSEKWRASTEAAMQASLKEMNDRLDATPTFDLTQARKYLAELNKLDDPTDSNQSMSNWQAQQKAHQLSPGGRAISKLLMLMGAKTLATIPVGRTVFAINPTKYQRALPNRIDGILKTWDSEQQVWQKALEANPPVPPKDGHLSSDPRFSKYGDHRANRVLMVVRRYGPKSNINFMLTGYNALGEPQFMTSVDLSPRWLIQRANIQKVLEEANVKGQYTLTKESQERLKFSSLEYKDDSRPTPQQVAKFADPVGRDPLSFEHSEVLFAYAEVSKLNLVASLNDMITLPVTQRGDVTKPIDLEGYLKYNELLGYLQVVREDKWLTVKLSDIDGEPDLPEDRFTVRKLIQSGLQNGFFTLEALAEYSQTADAQWNPLSFNLARILLPRSERLLQDMETGGLKFYGLLSPVQQKSLRAGDPVAINTLNPKAKESLIEFALQNESRSGESGLWVKDRNVSMQSGAALQAEPTEFLARGISGDMVLAKVNTEETMMVGTKNGQYVAWTHFMTPEAYARSIRQPNSAYSKEDDFWLGQIVKLNLIAALGSDAQVRLTLKEHQYDLRKSPMRVDQMPSEIRKRMESG